MTYKTEVIERFFWSRWNEEQSGLNNPVVSLPDISEAIKLYNDAHPDQEPVSNRNPANFAKDFWRTNKRANENWPKSVLSAGYTGRPLKGGGNSFVFIPLAEGQLSAVDLQSVPAPTVDTRRVYVESVSLPLASKRLGRTDEPWLIQVLIKLRVFETHLALSSQQHILQLDHLQTNVKLNGAEIDALFLGVSENDQEELEEVIVCCEAKSRNDDIVPSQILDGVRAAFGMDIEQEKIIPLAVKAVAPSEVYVVEFHPIMRKDAQTTQKLDVATSAIYVLVPPVKGIGSSSRRPKKAKL